MKKILLFLFIIVCGWCVQAQNLVLNCSFEDTVYCPNDNGILGSISECKDWYSAGTEYSTPDYFKACGQYPMMPSSVPYNSMGFQNAATGNSYAGIVPWIIEDSITAQSEKEFIGTKLITPLAIGQRYFVSFKVSFTVNIASDYASNKTGALFSTVKYSNANLALIKNFAHIYTNEIITDTANWVPIKGWFTADSAYQYINIGNFFDNAHTDTLRFYNIQYWGNASYYYIDNVCVSLNSTQCECTRSVNIKENKPESLISVNYDAESKNVIIKNSSITNKISEIRMFDITGKLIYNTKLINKLNEISTINFPKSIYLVNILSNNAVYNFKIFNN